MSNARFVRCSLAAAALAQALSAGPISNFIQTNLVSSIPGMAPVTDPALINPWGISAGATTPFWIADNGTGLSTLYTGAGVKQGLVVTIPVPGGGPSLPTGTVNNPGAAGGAFNGDAFLFSTIRGTIAGWRGALGTMAETLVDNSASGAVYTGLSAGTIGPNTYLYAADFGNAHVTVFPSTGAPALTGNFTDPNIPAGYAPFNVQTLGTQVFVTYAVVDPMTGEDLAGPGNGIVDVYDLNGVLQGRVVSNGAELNSPWGLALAPVGFGPLGGDLLVGNLGDGLINAYRVSGGVGTFVGTIADVSGNPLSNEGLWGLKFGNSGPGFRPGTLYLTAGLEDETQGLFAEIDAVPEPGTFGLLAAGVVLVWLGTRFRRSSN